MRGWQSLLDCLEYAMCVSIYSYVYFANGHGCELHVNVNLYSKLDHINFPKWNEKKNRKRKKKSYVLLYEAFAFAILRHCHLKREWEQLTSLLLILSVNLFFSCFSSYFIIILLTNFMCLYICVWFCFSIQIRLAFVCRKIFTSKKRKSCSNNNNNKLRNKNKGKPNSTTSCMF